MKAVLTIKNLLIIVIAMIVIEEFIFKNALSFCIIIRIDCRDSSSMFAISMMIPIRYPISNDCKGKYVPSPNDPLLKEISELLIVLFSVTYASVVFLFHCPFQPTHHLHRMNCQFSW